MLPTDVNKRKLYQAYVNYLSTSFSPTDILLNQVPIPAETPNLREPVSYTSFIDLWSTYWKDKVSIIKPRSDLCDVCDNYMRQVMYLRRSGCQTDAATDVMADWTSHRLLARQERECYQASIVPTIDAHYVHISFDFSQKVRVPFSAQQVGKAFYKTAFAIHIFGLCEETSQVNDVFLFSEGCEMAKSTDTILDDNSFTASHDLGANSVVSMLYSWLLRNQNRWPLYLHIHADNCTGQNKNNTMLQFLSWTTDVGITTRWEMSFMIAGHTKFSPDGVFGKIKYAFSHCDKCDDITDFASVVDGCTRDHSIRAVVYRSDQSSTPWHWRDWRAFLKVHYGILPKIKSYHHFKMDDAGRIQVCLSLFFNAYGRHVSFHSLPGLPQLLLEGPVNDYYPKNLCLQSCSL